MDLRWNRLDTTMQRLSELRSQQGIDEHSAVEIVSSARGLYAAIFHGSNGKLALKIGPQSWTPGSHWQPREMCSHFALWTC